MPNLINTTGLQKFATKLWDKIKARDISSFVYSTDKATNTKTLKAKRADGALGDININIDDLASQTLNNTFDGENIFKDVYIKDTVLTYVNNENATFFMGGENQYSAVKELVVPANTYVSSIVIALKDDLAIGDTVTGINIGTISTDNVVLEHLITRGTGRVEANSYSVLTSNKVVVVPINKSFSQDIYFMIGAKGMLWNSGSGYHVIGGSDMPRPNATVYPNGSNYFGKVAIIGKGASLKERFGNMAKVNEFNSFTAINNFRKILFEDGYLNTAILSKIDNPRATMPSNSNNVYSASPAFKVQANTFVDKIIIGLRDDIEVDAEVTGVNVGTVSTDNIVLEHLIKQGRARAIANTYSEISCSKIISVPINRYFNQDVYFMIGAKGMLWNEARYANVTAAGGENGMPNAGTRLSPNSTNYVGKFLMIGQGLSIKETFEKAINTHNTVNQATSVGGNDNASKLVKLSSNGKLDESLIPAIALNEVIPATDKNNTLSKIGTGVGQINRGDVVTLADGSIHIYKGRPAGQIDNNFDRDFLSLSVGNGTVKRVNNIAPGADGNVTVLAEDIKYVNGQNTTVKQEIANKINISDAVISSEAGKIVKLDDGGKINENMFTSSIIKSNQDNNFTKHNSFNDYSPTVHRLFTRKHINSHVNNSSNLATYQHNKYFAPVNEVYTDRNKRITHLLLPVRGANVGEQIAIDVFAFNNNKRLIQLGKAKKYPVVDEEIAGCKCVKITFDIDSGTNGIGFGFMVMSTGVGAVCVQGGSNVAWTSTTQPTKTTILNPNENISFPYKICYETTSELVTRFELENVTQMYPKTLIGEMKQLAYDGGNCLEDGENTWLRANGQAINSNDYPELYEKFHTSRTDDDIEVTIPSIDSQVGYYYICAK